LGCGTGLTTVACQGIAAEVVGIEPAEQMFAQAVRRCRGAGETAGGVTILNRSSGSTGLEGTSIDIVTAADAIHWMPLEETWKEIGRILRPQGIAAFFGAHWPPASVSLSLDKAVGEFASMVREWHRLAGKLPSRTAYSDIDTIYKKPPFGESRKLYLHQQLQWSSEDYIGWMLSWAQLSEWIAAGALPQQVRDRWESVCEAVRNVFCSRQCPIYFTWTIRVFAKEVEQVD
jgi:SAM-dependent methyltransferase